MIELSLLLSQYFSVRMKEGKKEEGENGRARSQAARERERERREERQTTQTVRESEEGGKAAECRGERKGGGEGETAGGK